MIDLSLFADKPVAVMGLARSGLAAARALAAGGAEVRAWDDGEAGREAAREAGLPLTDLGDAGNWKGVETLVLSPGIPHTHPAPHVSATRARERGAEIIGDIELLIRACPDARYVADHRHQRQIHNHGAARPYPEQAGCKTGGRRQYRPAGHRIRTAGR